MRLRLIAGVVVVATILGGAWVGRDLLQNGSGGGWSHEAGEAFDAERVLLGAFERGRPNLTFLVQARTGDVDDREVEAAAADFIEKLEARSGITQVESYWSLGQPSWMRSDDGSLALIHARLVGLSEDYADRAESLTILLRGVDDTVRITMGGQAVVHADIRQAVQQSVLPIALLALVSLALVLIALRHPVATALIALAAAIAVAFTLFGLYGVAQFDEVPVAAVVFGAISAWGLASASGYLVVSRYLAERAAGANPRSAVVATVSTAGRTVAIAAAVAAATGVALLTLPTSLVRATAYALGLAGVATGLSAIVGLGLMLAVVGVDLTPHTSIHPRRRRLDGLTRAAQRRPVVTALIVVALLGPLLIASAGARLSEPTVASLGPDNMSRQVAQQITARFPSNDADAPFIVSPSVIDFSTSGELAAEYAAELSRIDGVARVDSDQGTFVNGARTPVPRAITSRHVGEQRTWLEAPLAGFGGGTGAERLATEISEVMAPFRVVIGGTAARQIGTADAMSARTPIFAGVVLLVIVLLTAWLLRSTSAAIRAALVAVLMTAAGMAVVQFGFARGSLRTLLSFSSAGAVAAVGPPIAWVMSIGVAAAAVIFAWGAIREVFDLTRDAPNAVRRALLATRKDHLVANALLVLPLLALLVNGWREAKLVGAAVVTTGLAMMVVGRFVAVPAATAIAPVRMWGVARNGEVRRLYPATPAGLALVAEARAREEQIAAAEEAARMEAEAELAAATVLADTPAGDALAQDDGSGDGGRPVAPFSSEREVDEPEHPVTLDAEGSAESDEVAPQAAVPASAPAEPPLIRPIDEPASPDVVRDDVEVVAEVDEPQQVSAADAAVAEQPVVAESTEPQPADEVVVAAPPDDAAADVSHESATHAEEHVAPVAATVAADNEPASAPEDVDAVESPVAETAEVVDEVAAGAESAPVVAAAPPPGPKAAKTSEPTPGTVDVASLTASVIAAIEPAKPFTMELNSAFVANPANNLSRVMEAILRDASSRGGEEVLVYGHASRDRYRWMVVDSGPQAENDATRARTLAEAQRFIRRVGGVVECRPEGDFTVFVVEIPMAS